MNRASAIGWIGVALLTSASLGCAVAQNDGGTTGAPTHDAAVDSGGASDASETGSAPFDTGTGLIDTSTPPPDDTGTLPIDDTGTPAALDDSGAPPSDTGTSGGDAGPCGTTPTLHPGGTGVYCPFSATTPTGKNITCAAGQQCCETPISAGTPSTCAPTGSACSYIVWQCEGPANCSAGQVCCATATSIGPSSTCPYDKAVGFKSAKCVSSCTTWTLCEAAADCPAGKACVPMKAAGNAVGYCK